MQSSYKTFFHRPIFWFVFISTSVICGLISYWYLPKALPILDLTITMQRTEALQKSALIAKQYQLGPLTDYRQAAYFTSGSHLQNYIELEAGGKDAWQKLINSGKYYPYTWCVRHFKESEVHEVLIQFTPAGKPYGFDERISESLPGAQLALSEAQKKAEHMATAWGIDLSVYHSIEKSQHKALSGRLDHTFVYERTNDHIGEAHYRLSITVSGDKVTKLHHYMDVPEAFSRRYEEMRSANNLIENTASALVYILYILIGCIIGIIILIQQQRLIIMPAFKWGVFIAFGQALIQINQLPLTWCSYNTAESAQGHIIQILIESVIAFIYYTALYTLTFAAAESLTRKAFGHHIQLWQAWKNPVASSYQVLGRTLIGYGMIPFDFLFITLFYGIGSRLYGWWNPASTLVEPNILATYIPWVTALARALGAGFWEECLFRAVPLSLGALIGQRFNRRKTGITIAFIVQAIIFGAAHANYPAQPSYIRLVELIIPSFSWGALYLVLGLIPTIISHAVYDALLFGIPLFITTGYNKYIILVGIFIPLAVILYKRLRARAWHNLAAEYYNKAWQPALTPPAYTGSTCQTEPLYIHAYKFYLFIIAGLAAALIWVYYTPFTSVITPVNTTKTEAVSQAQKALKLDHSWSILPSIIDIASNQNIHDQHEFIWQTQPQVYKQLLGTYLQIPEWNIRFARFTGDLNERAHEYHIAIGAHNTISRITQQLPDNKPGARLTEQQARKKAHNYLTQFYHVDPKQLEEISAALTYKPARTDWHFIFIDRAHTLKLGQLRIAITLAGDTVSDSGQYIYIPENWLRTKQQETQTTNTIGLIILILKYMVMAFAIWQSLRLIGSGHFPLFHSLSFAIIIGIFTLANTGNNWPSIISDFSTVQPYITSIFMHLTNTILALLKSMAWIGLVAGAAYRYQKQCIINQQPTRIITALCLGLLYAGSLAIAKQITYQPLPEIPLLLGINSYVPWFSIMISYLLAYIQQAASIVLFLSIITFRFSFVWLMSALSIAVILSSNYQHISYISWISTLILFTLIMLFLMARYVRWNTPVIPLIIVVPYILNLISQCFHPGYTESLSGYICSIIMLILFSYAWMRSLEKQTATT
jgi:membrane protease YdiL (CAAX protease family)